MTQHHTIEEVRVVKEKYEEELLARANVVGVGIGYQYKNGRPTDEVVIVVSVTAKKSRAELAEADIIPAELDGIPTDVQEVGQIRAL
jgi:hypothetical protein